LQRAGAHYVVDNLAEISAVIEEIELHLDSAPSARQ
jgi:hypothetical protein